MAAERTARPRNPAAPATKRGRSLTPSPGYRSSYLVAWRIRGRRNGDRLNPGRASAGAAPHVPRLGPVRPPHTPRRPVWNTYQGGRVRDDYRGLENAGSQEVRRWSRAQNRAARSFLDALPARPYLLRHVEDGTPYPSVLFATGENDRRVNPFHSRKMVARLQAASTSDAPVLLRTSGSSGHGMVRTSEIVEMLADVQAFLLDRLGMDTPHRTRLRSGRTGEGKRA
ncbi:MAG: prolyl oligopeptidase family serine peptidase [Euryarchaeota archaeon]|nr:prolyl oligopeptidase family serine peptidase [Euryarchaeota archaeon]